MCRVEHVARFDRVAGLNASTVGDDRMLGGNEGRVWQLGPHLAIRAAVGCVRGWQLGLRLDVCRVGN